MIAARAQLMELERQIEALRLRLAAAEAALMELHNTAKNASTRYGAMWSFGVLKVTEPFAAQAKEGK